VFINSLFTFDKENIPDRVIKAIAPFMDIPEFTPAGTSTLLPLYQCCAVLHSCSAQCCSGQPSTPSHPIHPIHPFFSPLSPQAIEKASKACTAICMWARAMYKFHFVNLSESRRQERRQLCCVLCAVCCVLCVVCCLLLAISYVKCAVCCVVSAVLFVNRVVYCH
jgi:hypothetical protein